MTTEITTILTEAKEAAREAEKIAMTRDLYAAHGKYYNAMANTAGARAAGEFLRGLPRLFHRALPDDPRHG